MQTRHTNSRPSDIPVEKAKERKKERKKEILKNSVLKVGKWPVSKSEVTNRNQKHLIR